MNLYDLVLLGFIGLAIEMWWLSPHPAVLPGVLGSVNSRLDELKKSLDGMSTALNPTDKPRPDEGSLAIDIKVTLDSIEGSLRDIKKALSIGNSWNWKERSPTLRELDSSLEEIKEALKSMKRVLP